jgi:predicted negative regulator of RcsB-dependent stress response
VDGYVSDKEQLAILKKWIQENWISVFLGVALGLGIVYGWRFYKDWRQGRQEQSSAQLLELMRAAQDGSTERVLALGQQLSTAAATDQQAQLARLLQARVLAEQGRLDETALLLREVMGQAGLVSMRHIARLRLARVLSAQGKAADAMALLNVPDTSVFAADYDEARGDVLLVQGDTSGARAAYRSALDKRQGADGSQVLKMKLDDLGDAG